MSSTRQGAFISTYSVAAPISSGLAAPIPPSRAPPLILLGGSAPIDDRFDVEAARRLDDPGADLAGADHLAC